MEVKFFRMPVLFLYRYFVGMLNTTEVVIVCGIGIRIVTRL